MECITSKVHPVIIISGFNATGSSTLAKKLCNALDLEYVYAGAMMRKLCVDLGYCPPNATALQFEKAYKEFQKRLHEDPSLNKQLDDKLLRTIKTTQTPICVESRTAAALCTKYNIPVILKIWIHSDIEARVQRFKYKQPNTSLSDEEIKELLLQRDRSEIEQYKTQYGIDISQPHLYNDIVLDTTNMNIEEAYFALTKHPVFQKRIPLLEEFTQPYEHIYRYRCLKCNYLYEGPQPPQKCPKCGNQDPSQFVEIEC